MKFEITTTTTRTGILEVNDELMATFNEDEKHDYILDRIQHMEDEQLLDILDEDCDWQDADDDDDVDLEAETVAEYNERLELATAYYKALLAE